MVSALRAASPPRFGPGRRRGRSIVGCAGDSSSGYFLFRLLGGRLRLSGRGRVAGWRRDRNGGVLLGGRLRLSGRFRGWLRPAHVAGAAVSSADRPQLRGGLRFRRWRMFRGWRRGGLRFRSRGRVLGGRRWRMFRGWRRGPLPARWLRREGQQDVRLRRVPTRIVQKYTVTPVTPRGRSLLGCHEAVAGGPGHR